MSKRTYEGIVVLGAQRSGTTLLRRLLNAHESINCPPETNVLNAAARFLREEQSSGGLTIGVLPGLAFSGINEQDVIESLAEFALGFLRRIAAEAGKPVWAEKTAVDSFYVDPIFRLLGSRCRYVCIYRHGLDAACSMIEHTTVMDRYLAEVHAYVRQYSSPMEAMARLWSDANERIADFVGAHPRLACALRYEDLIAHPADELNRLFAFLELPVDTSALIDTAFRPGTVMGLGDWKTSTTHGLDASSVGRWKSLDKQDIARLAPAVNPTLDRLGYPPVPVAPPTDPAETRNRYRMLQLIRQMKADAQSDRRTGTGPIGADGSQARGDEWPGSQEPPR